MAGKAAGVEVIGGAELARAFDHAADRVAHGTPEADHDAAELVREDARRRVPVRSGRLLSTLRILALRKGDYATGAVLLSGKRAVPYARVQEYGWPARNIPAQAYMRPAVVARRDDIERAYGRAVGDEVRRFDREAPR